MHGFSTKEVDVRSRYTCIRSPPNLANRSLLQRNPTILRLLLSKIALRPPWSPPPPRSSAALAAAMIPAMDSSGEVFLWRSVSGRFRFNWSQGDLRPPWTPASARVRPPSTGRYWDPIRPRSSGGYSQIFGVTTPPIPPATTWTKDHEASEFRKLTLTTAIMSLENDKEHNRK